MVGPMASPSVLPDLRDRSVEELRVLLTDPAAYSAFFHTLDQVAQMDNLRDELRRGNVELAKKNLSRESEIAELKTQCRIIRGTELAAAQEQLDGLRQREHDLTTRFSPSGLLALLGDAAQELDTQSEELHRKLLAGQIEAGDFLQKYRALRHLYHMRVQTRMAALASLTS